MPIINPETNQPYQEGLDPFSGNIVDPVAAERLQKTARDQLLKTQQPATPAPSVTPPPVSPPVSPPADTVGETEKTGDPEYDALTQQAMDALQSQDDFLASQQSQMVNAYDKYKTDLDAEFVKITADITESYKTRFDDLRLMNKAIAGNVHTAQIRSGRARYASEIALGNISAEETAGQKRIAQLTSDMNTEINLAKQAARSNARADFEVLNFHMQNVRDIQAERSQAALDQLALARDFQDRVMEKAKQAKEQQKFDFEVYKFEQEQAFEEYKFAVEQTTPGKPLVVSPGSSLYDPITMEYLGTAPKPVDTKAPELERWGGKVHQWNPGSQSWETIGDEDEFGGVNSSTVIDWANSIANGTAKLSDITGENATELKGQVLAAMNKLPPKQEDVTKTEEKISALDALLVHAGMKGTVGVYGVSRWTPFSADKAERKDFLASIEQLVSQKALQSLIDAKASGATFGALSEGEMKILKAAVVKFDTWARDKDGNSPASSEYNGVLHHYEAGEEEFKAEIERIKKDYTDLLAETTGTQSGSTGTPESATTAVQNYYNNNPDQRQYVESLYNMINEETGQPYTEEERAQILGLTFNQVGGDTKLATKVAPIPEGSSGGQCGRFVNQHTGLGMGDSYESKLAKMDKSIKEPKPGMVFVMPYSWTGHTGIILSVSNGVATVKDSNWSLDEKIKVHQIPVSKMTGFTYA